MPRQDELSCDFEAVLEATFCYASRRHARGDRLRGAACPVPSPLGSCAPPARGGVGGARLGGGFPPLPTCGWGRGRRRESPVLVECLERSDPHTVGHAPA